MKPNHHPYRDRRSALLKRMRAGDDSWEAMVPEAVATVIKRRKLLGYLDQAA